MDLEFDAAHAVFLRHHLNKRTGERRGRLERGHQEAEMLFCKHVWWPIHGHFEHLHPEYEVLDWRGHAYYCDFAWLTPAVKLVIEIKGFGPHVRDMDRQRYCQELNRETFLAAIGFQVISFAYDDVAQRPQLCSTLLRMVLDRYRSAPSSVSLKQVADKALVRLACSLQRPLRPIDAEMHLNMSHRAAVRALQSLCARGWFAPTSGPSGKHTVKYVLKRRDFANLL